MFGVQISVLSHKCVSTVIQIKSLVRSVHCFVICRFPLPFLFPCKLFVKETAIFPQFEFASYIPVVILNIILCPLGFLLISMY